MKKIKLTVSGGEQATNLFLRQTPGCQGIWGDCEFSIDTNEPDVHYDWWFVLHISALIKTQSAMCDPRHLVFMSMEPTESVGSSTHTFLRQFSKLVLTDLSYIKDFNCLVQNAITWWVGVTVTKLNGLHRFSEIKFDYDSLSALKPNSNKIDRISLVVSNKRKLPGHRKRLEFIEVLKNSRIAHLIDIYGDGYKAIDDKWQALSPYKYHLVLENSCIDNYWSEKLGDAFLGYCYPIYFGCTNIDEFFPNNSLTQIDLDYPEECITKIESTLVSKVYENNLNWICESREMILNKYNIFNLMSSIATTNAQKFSLCTIHPNRFFLLEYILKKTKNYFKNIL